jgi:sugar lactone lactonase YvrE
VVAKGISHPNGIRYRDGNLFVTVSALPKVKRPDGLLVSGVYRFPAAGKEIAVNNTLDDKSLIASFVTHNRFTQYGLDGIVFDSKGNLYVGNFGDGTIHKLVLDAAGDVVANTLFAHTDFDTARDPAQPGFLSYAAKTKMRTTDGICVDADNNLYVADFSNNSIDKVTPSGQITVLAHNDDTDGQTGLLNEPGEPIVWGGRLIVSNFDAVSGPDKVHTAHHSPATLSVIELSR